MALGINKAGLFRPRFGVHKVPHLGVEIRVRRRREADRLSGVGPGTLAVTRDMMGSGYVELYFADWVSPPTVAHEIVHAIQFICRRKGIDMIDELEHVAYLADYITGKVLGYAFYADVGA